MIKPGSDTKFLLSLALGVALLRLMIFDFAEFFERRAVPSHDFYQGAGLFCPNMHAMRIEGDLAWWNPVGQYGGYAQCYNAFFSPLAPTAGHIVFIVWAQLVGLLSKVGIAIPEYVQYLVVNLAILPFLTYLALAYLAERFLRSRVSIALVVIVYAFSGLGLWNSAWFYYQEPATVFFLLGSSVAVCQQPTLRRGLLLLAAILVQFASINYWTLYNCWFVVILLGAYGVVYRNQLIRLLARTTVGIRRSPKLSVALAAACTLVVLAWVVTLGSVLKEQSGKYVRHPWSLGGTSPYTEVKAFNRVQEMRRYTIELFNPKLSRALDSYKLINEAHNARYVGAMLLPLLAAFWFLPLRRRELWLCVGSGLLFVVCLAPPFLLKLWSTTPFMDHIVHLFYFYSHHLQLFLVLLAASVLDRVLAGRLSTESHRRLNLLLMATMAMGMLALIGLGIFSHRFALNDRSLEALLLAAVLAMIAAFVVRHCLLDFRPARRFALCGLLLAVLTADATRYYWEGSRADQEFTVHRYPNSITPLPLPKEIRAALKKPWEMPRELSNFQAAMYENMPVASEFWPTNQYNRHRQVYDLIALPEDVRNQIHHPLLAFHSAVSSSGPSGELFYGPGHPDFRVAANKCGYNEFEFDVQAPADGFAVIGLLKDAAWRLELDGTRVATNQANLTGMSTPVTAGSHRLRLSYQPLGRRLYWPACWILEAALAGLAAIAIMRRTRQSQLPAAATPCSNARFSDVWSLPAAERDALVCSR